MGQMNIYLRTNLDALKYFLETKYLYPMTSKDPKSHFPLNFRAEKHASTNCCEKGYLFPVQTVTEG